MQQNSISAGLLLPTPLSSNTTWTITTCFFSAGPQDNALLRRVLPELPIQIKDDTLLAGDREPISLKGSVLSMYYFNPPRA